MGIHLSIDHLFKAPFRPVQGGLFQKVTKADVGDGAIRLMEQGVTLLCWADPFFPDPSGISSSPLVPIPDCFTPCFPSWSREMKS